MTQPFGRPESTQSVTETSVAVTRALADALQAALANFPEVAPDPESVAQRLASMLTTRLPEARSVMPEARGSAAERESVEALVLEAITRHPAGREPGLSPGALAVLTGLPVVVLGAAVSALVQAGGLVRDAWLVRLPHADDLLPQAREAARGSQSGREYAGEDRQTTDRRAIGDRRAVGERRLYDRRTQS